MTWLSCAAASAGASAITAANPLIRVESATDLVHNHRYALVEVKVVVTVTRSSDHSNHHDI